MTFDETDLGGAFVIELDLHADERGFFARTFARETFDGARPRLGCRPLEHRVRTQCRKIRGMHFQLPPHGEVKPSAAPAARSSTSSSISARSRRPSSRAARSRLDDENRRTLYVPERFAHGSPGSYRWSKVASYQMSAANPPRAAASRTTIRGWRSNRPLPVSGIRHATGPCRLSKCSSPTSGAR